MVVLNRKNMITVLLIIGLLLVVYFSVTRTQHGDKTEWLKKHGTIAERRANPGKFCIECHTEERGQTQENYCNKCHDINAKHKPMDKWRLEHGPVASQLIKQGQDKLGDFCLDCHRDTRESTKNDFCNACHKNQNGPEIK